MLLTLIALLSLSSDGEVVSAALASEPQTGTVQSVRPTDPEKRTHYVLSDSTGMKLGEVTQIARRSPEADRDFILYRSTDGDRLVLESAMIYATQSTEKAIRNVKGDAHVTARVKLPFTGKTRTEVLNEFRQNPELFAVMTDQLELTTNGGAFRIADAEFKAPARQKVTRRIRQVVPFDLLEAIERASTTVLATEFADIIRAEISDFLLYRPDCTANAPSVVASVPDCDFDEEFGFPCTKDQQSRVKHARQTGEATSY